MKEIFNFKELQDYLPYRPRQTVLNSSEYVCLSTSITTRKTNCVLIYVLKRVTQDTERLHKYIESIRTNAEYSQKR